MVALSYEHQRLLKLREKPQEGAGYYWRSVFGATMDLCRRAAAIGIYAPRIASDEGEADTAQSPTPHPSPPAAAGLLDADASAAAEKLVLGMAPERRELIGRIIQKIEPALVDSVSASQGQPPDPAFLLNAGLQLGVCSTVDMDLMTGMAADTDQLAMITALLEMAETVADQRLTRQSLSATIQHNSALLTALCDEDVDNMLSSECELLPPDLTKRCARSSQEHRDLHALRSETDAIERLVSEKVAALEKHQATPSKHGGVVTVGDDARSRQPSAAPTRRLHLAKTIAVHAETMGQLAESFIRSCSTELQDLMQPPPKSKVQAEVGAAVLHAKRSLCAYDSNMRLLNDIRARHKQITVDTAHQFSTLERAGSARSSSGGGGGGGDGSRFNGNGEDIDASIDGDEGNGAAFDADGGSSGGGGGYANARSGSGEVCNPVSHEMLRQLRHEAAVLAEAAHLRRR